MKEIICNLIAILGVSALLSWATRLVFSYVVRAHFMRWYSLAFNGFIKLGAAGPSVALIFQAALVFISCFLIVFVYLFISGFIFNFFELKAGWVFMSWIVFLGIFLILGAFKRGGVSPALAAFVGCSYAFRTGFIMFLD